MTQDVPRRCSPSSGSTRSTSTRPGCSPRCGPPRRDGADDPCVVVLTPGVLQRGLLRARPAGPADGRRAGRGPRPVLHRQPGLRAHHAGQAPGRRDLPPGRRRLPRPAAVPARLGARLPRPDQRRPGRATSRSPTRSATASPTTSCIYTYVPDLIRYYLGEEPLLRQRGVATGSTTRTCSTGCSATWTSWCSSRSTAPAARASSSARTPTSRRSPSCTARVAGQPARLDRAAAGGAVHVAGADRRDARAAAHRPAAVRGQRRQRRVAAARRPDPGGAARGRAGRQLQPGRRLQGHLGAGQRPVDASRQPSTPPPQPRRD